MSIKPWSRMPTEWIQDGTIKKFSWKSDGSAGTAALMLFFTMCHYASERFTRPTDVAVEPSMAGPLKIEEQIATIVSESGETVQVHVRPNPDILFVPPSPETLPPWMRPPTEPTEKLSPPAEQTEELVGTMVARLTYDDLGALTGLSRKLIAAGLKLLVERKMIWRIDDAGSYGIVGFGKGKRWAKLPGLVHLSAAKTSFVPFTHFHLRSKHELNAMKMYLYYVQVRDRAKPYSEPSFETIYARTGVPERDIPTANSLLLTTRLLARAGRESTTDAKQHESNHYYLNGYKALFQEKKVGA